MDEPTRAENVTRVIAHPPADGESVLDAIDQIAETPPPVDELTALGGYQVVRLRGRGGMGSVYEAVDPTLGRTVALKVLLPGRVGSRKARDRFLREARAAAAVKHDNVVTIYQVGEDAGAPFLAMEFLHGTSLQDELQRDGVRVAEAVRVGREVAAGLAAAHALGVVRRDDTPDTVWLEGPDRRVKLIDFGLARMADEGADTKRGLLIGTPAYMAPEQARGDVADARTDLFGRRGVLYRMVTRKLPFPRTSAR